MCRLCDAYSLLPKRWMMVKPRATRDTVVQGFERPRAPRAPSPGPAPRSYLTIDYALCADVRGESGEFQTRGYSVMQRYWNEPEKSAEAIDSEGWMHTGDLAVMDPAGYVQITGRIKDLIIRGGENVSPREVEEFLYGHPEIEDVQVVGVPDNRFGEEICAWIVLNAGQRASAEEMKAFCQGEIAHYKVPRYLRFVEELPLTVTGKIQKFVMRERMIEELGLSTTACA